MKFKAKDESDPEMVRAAGVATILANMSAFKAQVEQEAIKEYCRQLVYGLSPSEGVPDVRPNRPRYEQ